MSSTSAFYRDSDDNEFDMDRPGMARVDAANSRPPRTMGMGSSAQPATDAATDAMLQQKLDRMRAAAVRRPGSAARPTGPLYRAPSASGLLIGTSSSLSTPSPSPGGSVSTAAAGESAFGSPSAYPGAAVATARRSSLSAAGHDSDDLDDDDGSEDMQVHQDPSFVTGPGSSPHVRISGPTAAFAPAASTSSSLSSASASLSSASSFSPNAVSTPLFRSGSAARGFGNQECHDVPDLQGVNDPNKATVLLRPPPKGVLVHCFVRRQKSGLKKLNPRYFMYQQSGEVFLMAARKRGGKKTPSYLVSLSESEMSRDGDSFYGKLRSNFVGTEFRMFGRGENPQKNKKLTDGDVRPDLGIILYEKNMLVNKGPRKMTVAIPEAGQILRPRDEKEGILERFKDASLDGLVCLRNKDPVWNENLKAYVLNFGGRVTLASVKNFQLIDPERPSDVVVQFGKVDDDLFTLDFRYPLSPLQAFLIALSSLDRKLACE